MEDWLNFDKETVTMSIAIKHSHCRHCLKAFALRTYVNITVSTAELIVQEVMFYVIPDGAPCISLRDPYLSS